MTNLLLCFLLVVHCFVYILSIYIERDQLVSLGFKAFLSGCNFTFCIIMTTFEMALLKNTLTNQSYLISLFHDEMFDHTLLELRLSAQMWSYCNSKLISEGWIAIWVIFVCFDHITVTYLLYYQKWQFSSQTWELVWHCSTLQHQYRINIINERRLKRVNWTMHTERELCIL